MKWTEAPNKTFPKANLRLEICLAKCLEIPWFEAEYAYKPIAYKKKECIASQTAEELVSATWQLVETSDAQVLRQRGRKKSCQSGAKKVSSRPFPFK